MNQSNIEIDPATQPFATRLFYGWADRTWLQLVVFLALTTLAGIGYVRPELVTDLFQPFGTEETLATRSVSEDKLI